MVVAKQMDIRSNINKYFDMAYDGETILVPRKEDKNIVIISEDEYNRINQAQRINAYLQRKELLFNQSPAEEESALRSIKEDNLRRLGLIRGLKAGWNGNGAPPIPDKVISKVALLLDKMVIQPEIFPTALETIQFEFDNSRRDHMEIEIGVGDSAEVFTVTYYGGEITETISSDLESINERVAVFYG